MSAQARWVLKSSQKESNMPESNQGEDRARERHIRFLAEELKTCPLEERRYWWSKMAAAISSRSRAQVERMEVERGLR